MAIQRLFRVPSSRNFLTCSFFRMRRRMMKNQTKTRSIWAGCQIPTRSMVRARVATLATTTTRMTTRMTTTVAKSQRKVNRLQKMKGKVLSPVCKNVFKLHKILVTSATYAQLNNCPLFKAQIFTASALWWRFQEKKYFCRHWGLNQWPSYAYFLAWPLPSLQGFAYLWSITLPLLVDTSQYYGEPLRYQ